MLPLGAPLYALGAGGVLFEESTGLGRRRNLSVSVNFSEDIRFPPGISPVFEYRREMFKKNDQKSGVVR
jgi:hypothetical protein